MSYLREFNSWEGPEGHEWLGKSSIFLSTTSLKNDPNDQVVP